MDEAGGKLAEVRLSLSGLIFILIVSATACGPTQTPAADDGVLLVAAASDLQFAFTEIGEKFEQETGQKTQFIFGSTGNLTTQVENGAPYDLLAAANVGYIDRLNKNGLIISDTRQMYAQGHLVLAVNRRAGVQAVQLEDLLDPAVTRIAIANPAHAPYGLAAQEALQSAGLWEALQPKLVLGENVRQTLQFVQTGDVPVGLVALSVADAPEITCTLVPTALHRPLNQAVAIITGTPHETTARAFIEFVNSSAGREIMKRYGFLLPGEF